MKEIWVLRHSLAQERDEASFGPELSLSPAGVELARKVASAMKSAEVKFSDIQSSPYVRAFQTAMICSLIMKVPFPAVNYGLYSRDRAWSIMQGMTAIEMNEKEPELMRETGIKLYRELYIIAEKLEDGDDRVLCVSHGGLIEAAAAYASALHNATDFADELKRVPHVVECSGIIFRFSHAGYSDYWILDPEHIP